ncbi:6,7-dimethyl-8-ribityllumazine synthase [Taibaiella koreensis]|uniref:6,7-dimethyl-8-ribityllumazine synthase n=1 Tax=Taibaiella koreensis TaxID=1268548 RepID=UPI001F08F751|nr:6,7-dimethyl-8-ribityllumazine synthase [Taibaiella koreensis]
MAQSSESSTLLDITGLDDMDNPRVAIVATEWNDKIVAAQIAGARRVAGETGAVISHEIYVPGSFELPFACKAVWESRESLTEAPEAIIAFGAVIRGGTPHFEYVCKAVTEGILQLNLSLPIPVIFGVLTLDTEAQAWERLGGSHGHKGEEAMIAALKMIKMKNSL